MLWKIKLKSLITYLIYNAILLTISYFLNRFSFGHAFTLKTNINNMKGDKNPIFYTDANGLEMMQRKIDRFELL